MRYDEIQDLFSVYEFRTFMGYETFAEFTFAWAALSAIEQYEYKLMFAEYKKGTI